MNLGSHLHFLYFGVNLAQKEKSANMDLKLAALLLTTLYFTTAAGMPHLMLRLYHNHSKYFKLHDCYLNILLSFFTTAAQVHRIPRSVDTSGDVGGTNSCTPYVIVQRDGRDGLPGRWMVLLAI